MTGTAVQPDAPAPELAGLIEDPATLRATAESHGVCVRPILQELVGTLTGSASTVALPCGSTRANVCPPCADKARRLRMQQCREGWHREDDDPIDAPMAEDPLDGHDEDQDDEPDECQEHEAGEEDEVGSGRRVRSTRRRQDVPDLPRLPMSARTVGKTLTSPTGKTYRPSMFLTLTLPSYGRVGADGTPVDPATYDYRSAALDAMHFSNAVDRLWQNLRRCAGYKVQYFSAVEAQRRLAMHLHAAVRGIIPRSVVTQVIRATYHQVWWPPFDRPVYTGHRMPEWDPHGGGYICPYSGGLLPTWEHALDDLDDELDADPAMEPAHVVRFGTQADYQWFIPESRRTDRRVGYVTKYLTKDLSATYGDRDNVNSRQAAHLDRLMAQVRWLPCAPECANWLRYGIQPRDAEPGMVPGACSRRAHDPENLGYGGRRVLVSRQWTGKTLTEHKADRAEVVRQVLAEAGIDPADTDRCSATTTRPDGQPRFLWQPLDLARVDLGLWRKALLHSIREQQAWRAQYEAAKRAGPGTTSVRQPHLRGLPIASQLRPVVRLSGVSAANHEVTEGP